MTARPGLNLYISDRGVDNDSNPGENDGRFYEMAVNLPPLGDSTNRAPQVNAGPDLAVAQSVSATLSGSAGDDGLPDPPGTLSVAWSKVSGPGTVVFANPTAASTRATFGAVGSYVLRLTADDGDMAVRDDVSVEVTAPPPGGAVALDVPTGTGADDAEERSATTSVTGTDLELVVDGTTVQTVGIRFPGVAIPAGSTVTNAYVQFTVDEVTTGATSLTVTGQAADNPPSFSSTGRDVSTRPQTEASVGWTPAGWPTAGARGMDQRTPDLTPVLQEIVDRTGWASGNALALVITGTGTRTASATERGQLKAPLLHIEYVPAGGSDVAPTVSAGPDVAVTLPGAASLAGTVTDDGLPNPPGAVSAAWTRVSGPGTVSFADAAAPATTATFGAAGEYVLRLTADDGVLLAADEVTVTVSPAGPVNVAPTVSAGPDVAVTLPEAASLAGTVTDDGLPNPPGAVGAAWTTVSGPGTVTFANAAAAATTATFGAAGSYVLRLTGDDGALQAADEVAVTVTPANTAPTVSAGPDGAVTLPGTAALVGTVSDDGLPNPPGTVTTAWSKVSGPGNVTFANPAALTTTVTFAKAGTFVLSLTANDGARQATDQVTVTVAPSVTTVLDIPVATGSDDAEERPGSVSLTGTTLELVVDGTTVQTVGLRFTGVAVPAGATITGAWVQFTADVATSGTGNLTVAGQAADNASTFQAVASNITSRTPTTATVGWVPLAWKKAAIGAEQRTPDLAAVVQEIVGRPGWARGNAVVLVLTGSGTRVAAAFERGGGKAAVLHIEYHM